MNNTHFLAPSNFDETCQICGHAIRPGEIIIDFKPGIDYTVAHEACAEAAIEDAREMAADEMSI